MSDEETKTPAPVPEKFQKLVSEIEGMSVLDLSLLVKVLEDKFGVSAAAPAMMMAAAPAAAPAEEKTSFDVELTAAGGAKINVIKLVRDATGLGLKEAKEMVDGAPKVIKTGMSKADAEALVKKIGEAGGSSNMK